MPWQVGYLLGLGDRHPSNLMLDRYSGKLLHIDFGDCFEASMHREKFPERVTSFFWPGMYVHVILLCTTLQCGQVLQAHGVQVPFRLTRMMINAMEVSGVEGNFR